MAPPSTNDDLPHSIDQLWAELPKEDKSIVCNHLINYRGSGIECFFSSAIRLVYDASSSRNAARAIESDGHKTSTSLSTPKLTTREASNGDNSEASSSIVNTNAILTGAQPPASDSSASPKVSANNGRKSAFASVFALDPKAASLLGCVPPSAAAGVGILGATAACPKPVPFGKSSIFTGGSSPFSTSASVASTDATANNTTGIVLGNPLGNPSLALFSTAPKLSATGKLFGTRSTEIISPSTANNSPRSGLFGAKLGPGQSKIVSTHAPADSSAFGVNEVSVSLDLDKTSQSLFGDSKASNGGGSAGQLFGQAAPVTDRAGVPTSSGFSGIFGTPSFNDRGSLFGQGLLASGTDKRLAHPAFQGNETLLTASSGVAGADPAETSTSAGGLFGPSASNGGGSIFNKCLASTDQGSANNALGLSRSSNVNTRHHSQGLTTDEVIGAKRKVDEAEDAGSSSKKICVPNTLLQNSIEVISGPSAGMSASKTTQKQGNATLGSSGSGACHTTIKPFSDQDPFTSPASVIAAAETNPYDIENISASPQQSDGDDTSAGPSSLEPREHLALAKDNDTGSTFNFMRAVVEKNLKESLIVSANQRMVDPTFARELGSPPDSTQDHFIGYKEEVFSGAVDWFQSNHFLKKFENFSTEEVRSADYDRGQRWGSFPGIETTQDTTSGLDGGGLCGAQATQPSVAPTQTTVQLSSSRNTLQPAPQVRMLRCIDCRKVYNPAANSSTNRNCLRHPCKLSTPV
ncbi:hypothetical protein N0V93_007967 [Gnomoniopsis smithogilvyi]|uniref:Uncharacterized protein n=1 Tax=Gnomoniopsis smithogilvyi TaxID=1191159 RepID=A0A9W9CTG2_9PEZI|nr:hypothetical protein N0V93_007967 [Gnomoniopsis smithogilvyi]